MKYTVERLIRDLTKMVEANPELLKRRVVAYAHGEHLMVDATPRKGFMYNSDKKDWYHECYKDNAEAEEVLFIE